MRTNAREAAFKILFATQFSGDAGDTKRAVLGQKNLNKNDVDYCNAVLSAVSENKSAIAKIIDEHSRLFPESRLFPADRSVLFIAIAEIMYFDDIPAAVSVNEAANIASKYSSEKSATFISGILSEIIRERKDV